MKEAVSIAVVLKFHKSYPDYKKNQYVNVEGLIEVPNGPDAVLVDAVLELTKALYHNGRGKLLDLIWAAQEQEAAE